MSRATITIRHTADRALAHRWIERAPSGTRVDFKAARRTVEQNAKLWAALSDIASQLRWHGRALTTNQWKLIMMDSLKRESQLVPNIDGTGVVDIGRSSSDLSKNEMSQLIEIALAFGAQHGVVFNDPAEQTTIAPETETEMAEA